MKKTRARERLKCRKNRSNENTFNSFKKNRRSGSSKKRSGKNLFTTIYIFIFSNVWQKKRNASNSMKSKKKPRQLVDKLNEPKNLQQKNMFKVSLLEFVKKRKC